MAGIGFELRKILRGKSIGAGIRAYGYTGVITAGPLLLGILLLVGMSLIGSRAGLSKEDLDLMVCVVTYCLIGSLVLSSVFSMISARFIADMLYENHPGRILSSLMGVLCILLPVGGVCASVFLLFSGLSIGEAAPALFLFLILLAVWTQMNYMTAIKSYRGILAGYVLAVGISFLTAFLSSQVEGMSPERILYCCCAGYGAMLVADIINLCRFFPDDRKEPFLFLTWFRTHPQLAAVGLLMNVGLFAHLVIAWHSRVGEQIRGLFYAAPQYDIAALFAFLTVLVTTVTFVVSTEVRFYPAYRNYFDLFNGTGSIDEMSKADIRMRRVLGQELSFIVQLQFYTTLAMVAVGPSILHFLPVGFNDLMDGYFRILCVGYGAYALGNVMMLLLLYFADDHGAFAASILFAAGTTGAAVVSLAFPSWYYGFGFAFGSLAYFLFCWWRLNRYTKHLAYYVLSARPMQTDGKRGFLRHFR